MERVSATQPLSIALRDATSEVHARLGRALPLTDPELTLDAYVVVVEAYHGFYEPLEARLEAVAATSDGAVPMRGREKVWRLRADLVACGSPDDQIEALPRCPWVPELATISRALGCLYVIEGACLGGRLVARAVRARLGLGPSTGASFFEGYGAETGRMWRSLVDHLDACTTSRSEALGAAVDTFSALGRWLGARGVLR